jgi:hypothetical protein
MLVRRVYIFPVKDNLQGGLRAASERNPFLQLGTH